MTYHIHSLKSIKEFDIGDVNDLEDGDMFVWRNPPGKFQIVSESKFVQAGYAQGGLNIAEPLPDLVQGTWETIPFDFTDPPSKGATINPADDTFTFTHAGVWQISGAYAFTFDELQPRDRLLAARVYNASEDAARPAIGIIVPRTQFAATFTGINNFQIGAQELGDLFQLQISSGSADPFTTVEVVQGNFNLVQVSEDFADIAP